MQARARDLPKTWVGTTHIRVTGNRSTEVGSDGWLLTKKPWGPILTPALSSALFDRWGNRGRDPRLAWPPQVHSDQVRLPCPRRFRLSLGREGWVFPAVFMEPRVQARPPSLRQAGTQQPEGGLALPPRGPSLRMLACRAAPR